MENIFVYAYVLDDEYVFSVKYKVNCLNRKMNQQKLQQKLKQIYFQIFYYKKVYAYAVYKSRIDYMRIKNIEEEARAISKAKTSTTAISYKKYLKT